MANWGELLGRDRILLEPRCLGQAEEDVEGLDRLSGGALDQVVDDAQGQDAAASRVHAAPHATQIAAVDVLGGRRFGDDLNERLVAVRLGVERVQRASSE